MRKSAGEWGRVRNNEEVWVNVTRRESSRIFDFLLAVKRNHIEEGWGRMAKKIKRGRCNMTSVSRGFYISARDHEHNNEEEWERENEDGMSVPWRELRAEYRYLRRNNVMSRRGVLWKDIKDIIIRISYNVRGMQSSWRKNHVGYPFVMPRALTVRTLLKFAFATGGILFFEIHIDNPYI